MGILATALFFILLLTIGFVYNNWSLSFLILVMTSLFATLLAQSSVDEIMKQWESRRCDIEIMMTAQLFKPKDDPRTGGDFASENFQFCVKKTFREIITLALSPVFMMLHQQLDVTESINEVLNRLRVMMANLMDGFLKILEPFFLRFRTTGNQFALNQMKLLSAMGRAFGITQAALYIGMSLVITIENFVQFVIRVVMIIMYIILGLMVLLWFLILPVFIVIIITCQAIGNSPFGYLSRDVCGELCFDPTTRIRLYDGTFKSIGQCQLHDAFSDGTIIEGILHVVGTKEPMYSLDGIRVSGAHLVWSTYTDEWIPVQEHPDALPSFQRCQTLVCLRTRTRTIPLEGLTSRWSFRDWEELPLNVRNTDRLWDWLVSAILNGAANTGPIPTEIPLLKPSCQILYKTGEMRSVSDVQIGDSIYCSNGFTTVTGLYKGEAMFSDELTDGVWFQDLGAREWRHPTLTASPGSLNLGVHLTTESGCFWIQTRSISGFVRDFTEVGVDQLPLTYRYTRELLKKSFSREESCVSGSLSQASLSCSQPIF